ncbi:neutral zinc metallopeptidase [Saccharomonospora saliphila]|uniref:neutral zinc metallopeptidase n=1 Tax=Saccharomonospora saliphila TaxID=369829 RepID=UPI0003A7823C|nr:neutral zinc metallopeptidase [Saccharomonospora saliphila]
MTPPPPGPPPGPPYGPPGRGPEGGSNGPYGYGPAHRWSPRPPRRSAVPVVVGALAGVLVLVLGLVTVITLTRDDDPVAGGPTDTPAPPSAPSAPPTGASTSTVPETSSPAPGSSASPSPSGGVAPGGAEPGPRKIYALADHPILQDPDAGLRNRACVLPAWESSPAGAQTFFRAARECLDAAWEPFLRAYGLPFRPPTLHFPSATSFETECGTITVGITTAAYYCENNLYLPYDGLQTSQYGNAPGVYLALFAHEYGHHVQELAGIMDAAWERIYDAGTDSAAGREMSRRKELQAQCFSGMFLGAHVDQGGTITRQMYDRAWYDQETRGDDTSGTHDHGSNANYAKWWRAGAYDNRIADCNTFDAPSAEVA